MEFLEHDEPAEDSNDEATGSGDEPAEDEANASSDDNGNCRPLVDTAKCLKRIRTVDGETNDEGAKVLRGVQDDKACKGYWKSEIKTMESSILDS